LPDLLSILKFPRLLAICCGLSTALTAEWRDDIGHTRLQFLAGPELPVAVAQGLAQIEALESELNYAPNTGISNFTGKNFVFKSGSSAGRLAG